MIHLTVRRMNDFMRRVRLLQQCAGVTSVSAAQLLLRVRSRPQNLRTIDHRGSLVAFRGLDLDALFEVLAYQEYDFLRNLLSSLARPIVVDVGAHIGAFAIWALRVNRRARVLSIEADPATCAVAEMNVRSHSAQGRDWRVINRAAGATNGVIVRFCDQGPSMSHRIDPSGSIEIESIDLPAILDLAAPEGGPIDLMKVDIEGAEEDFLSSAESTLRRANALVVELHPYLCDTDGVKRLLERNFSEISTLSSRLSAKPLLYCRRGVPA